MMDSSCVHSSGTILTSLDISDLMSAADSPPAAGAGRQLQLCPDVLERIFSFLTFRDLLAAELVCTAWKHVIDTRSRPSYNIHNMRTNLAGAATNLFPKGYVRGR